MPPVLLHARNQRPASRGHPGSGHDSGACWGESETWTSGSNGVTVVLTGTTQPYCTQILGDLG